MSFSKSLLGWYDKCGRDLPWRKQENAYYTWISEIMLQQTQVNTVIPYFNRWCSRFPDVETLAKADYDVLLKLWEGLGYYRRCRNIHETAKIIVRNYADTMPDTLEDLTKLPGIGDYTAGAILSIGFNKKIPAVDANVMRIMARILMVKDPSKVKNKKRIITEVQRNISEERPGDFNQALMDLGSIVCKTGKPNCKICPVQNHCSAFASGLQDAVPRRIKKKKVPIKTVVAGMIWEGDKFYIQKRGPSGHLSSLWEFPGGKVEPGESLETTLKREVMEECGFKIRVGKMVGNVNHAYSHFKIDMTLFSCHLEKQKAEIREPRETEWITLDEINNYAFPKANHKLFYQISRENN